MKFTLIGPALYMDKKGSFFKKEQDAYVPVKNKVTDAEERYVHRHKGGTKDE